MKITADQWRFYATGFEHGWFFGGLFVGGAIILYLTFGTP